MERKASEHIIRNILRYETVGFGLILFIIWTDEVFDIPYYLLQAKPTPVNVVESIFETLMVIIIWLVIVLLTSNLLHHHLKGFLVICSSCKKIRDEKGTWTQMEGYISEHSSADFTHSICPECKEKLYPGLFKIRKQ